MTRTEDRMNKLWRVSAALAVTAVAACGGGGGGDGGGGDTVTYTVGGLAAGVNGPGLELRNGTESLSVPATGSFTFATRLAQGATYAVTVTGHPVGQTCSATNASGTMGTTNVTNIAVACVASAPVVGIQLHAGGYGGPGAVEGPAEQARFSMPTAVVADAQGNRYVADTVNHVIRRIAPDGEVSTLAGRLGANGSTDGVGPAARFVFPQGLALDGNGSLYVSDTGNHTIRRIRLIDNEVTTVAGVPGLAGTAVGGGSASQPATVRSPMALLFDGSKLLVADSGNHAVRALVAPHLLVPYAGVAGQTNDGDAEVQAERHLARFRWPVALARLPSTGEVLVLDQGNCVVRSITSTAVLTVAGANGDCRSVDGERSQARLDPSVPQGFSRSGGLAVGPGERVFVGDRSGLREMRPDGSLRSVALRAGAADWRKGGRLVGFAFESGTEAPRLLAAEPAVHAVVALTLGEDSAEVRVLTGQRVGGGTPVVAGDFGAVRGVGLAGRHDLLVHGQRGVHQISADGTLQHLVPLVGDGLGALAAARNEDGFLYAVINNDAVAGPEKSFNGYQDGQLRFSIPTKDIDGDPGAALIDDPQAIDLDSAGGVVVADLMASVLRRVDSAGNVTRLAGQQGVYETRLGDALNEASFSGLFDVAVAANDDIYVLDAQSVLKIARVNGRHVVSTVAQDIEGAMAIAVDAHHNLYVALGSMALGRPGCQVLRIGASDGLRSVLAGTAGRCTFVPGALPGALVIDGNVWTRMKVRDGHLWLSMESGVVRIGPLAP
jgi:serine/threonine-protein kinase